MIKVHALPESIFPWSHQMVQMWKTNKILHIPKNSLEIHPALHLPEDTRAMFDLNKLDYKVLRINHSLSFLCTGLQSFKKFSIKVKLGT